MKTVDLHAHPLLDRLYIAPSSKQRCPSAACPFGKRLGFNALESGQVGAIVSSVYPPPTLGLAYLEKCRSILQQLEDHLLEHSDSAVLACRPAEIDAALAQGKVAFIFAVEGGHVLEGRLENLERLYRWGVRSLTLTHFINNDLAASAFDPRRKFAGQDGLTSFGHDVVMEMNRLGMIIDLAHCSERAYWQALELTQCPVIVSHTGIRHFVEHEICLSDDQLQALARNGGVVGIILSAIWLKRYHLPAGISDLVKNILYVCDRVGVDYVGIGSDFNGTPPLRGVASAGDFPRIRDALSEAGMVEQDIQKVMGANFLNLFRKIPSSDPERSTST